MSGYNLGLSCTDRPLPVRHQTRARERLVPQTTGRGPEPLFWRRNLLLQQIFCESSSLRVCRVWTPTSDEWRTVITTAPRKEVELYLWVVFVYLLAVTLLCEIYKYVFIFPLSKTFYTKRSTPNPRTVVPTSPPVPNTENPLPLRGNLPRCIKTPQVW